MLLDKQALLKGVHQPEEKLLLAKVLDRADFSLKKHEMVFTDFIDRRMLEMAIQMVQKLPEISWREFGGEDACERRMIGFAPDYHQIQKEDFPIRVLEICPNLKFSAGLTHRDYLGSILGLGLDRGKIGDILVFEEKAFCYVAEEIADYIGINLTKAGKCQVKVSVLSFSNVCLPEPKIEEKKVTVSSLRLDAVLSAAFSLSRSKAQILIQSEKAFVDWRVLKNDSYQLKEGEIISLRGFGRVKLEKINGKTKKDRISILLHKYV